MFSKFRKRKVKTVPATGDRGLLVFEHTTAVIRAERLLKQQGWEVRVVGPPPELRTGCDLVIEFPLLDELAVVRLLTGANTGPLMVVPVNSMLLEPVDLLHVKELGRYLMVRAANMKITVDKETGMIVNVSGGGCPDVPYLAEQMVNKSLDEAPAPRDVGYTLCAYALQIAFDRSVELCSALSGRSLTRPCPLSPERSRLKGTTWSWARSVLPSTVGHRP
ncbi:MAG: DUF3343 domain-containing protein [Clostridiaceae bacterium]|nr:DUF3343 domain-containing protein [Clostridiaceae bacterium]